jgi:hypothetical protein
MPKYPSETGRHCWRYLGSFGVNKIIDGSTVLFKLLLNFESWVSQANHIFSSLGITSELESYGTFFNACLFHFPGTYSNLFNNSCSTRVLADDVYFEITNSATAEDSDPAMAFLFLCPDIQTDFCAGSSSFRWPACPAYWSFDPAGVDRLSMSEATHLGLPSIALRMYLVGRYWDASVYAGLRKFHQAKGYDPDSQEVARRFEHPLYHRSAECDLDGSFACGESNSPH